MDPNSITPNRSNTEQIHVEADVPAAAAESGVKVEAIKEEPLDPETTMVTVTRTTHPQTLLKPTILLTTHQTFLQPSVINVKPEPGFLSNMSASVKSESTVSISSAASSPSYSKHRLIRFFSVWHGENSPSLSHRICNKYM